MDFEKLIKRQDAILAEATAMIGGRGTPAALLARPLPQKAAQGERVKARIAALEAEKAASVARIDAEIAALQAEAAEIDAQLEGYRKQFAPALKAAGKDAKPAAAKSRKK